MAMYFVQHGLSLSKEINPDRPLSDDGRKEVERISVHLRKAGVKIYKVCHSGKTRPKPLASAFRQPCRKAPHPRTQG